MQSTIDNIFTFYGCENCFYSLQNFHKYTIIQLIILLLLTFVNFLFGQILEKYGNVSIKIII